MAILSEDEKEIEILEQLIAAPCCSAPHAAFFLVRKVDVSIKITCKSTPGWPESIPNRCQSTPSRPGVDAKSSPSRPRVDPESTRSRRQNLICLILGAPHHVFAQRR